MFQKGDMGGGRGYTALMLKNHHFPFIDCISVLRENIDRTEDDRWRRISHTFSRYGVGARYVKFYHGGMTQDMDMEEGWYGAKMTGSTVQVSYPDTQVTQQLFKCTCRRGHARLRD